MLNRGSGVTLWRQIEQILRREIAGGSVIPGGRLGTEYELAHRFSVNRHTVRQAIAGLREAGLVDVTQGRGIHVAESPLEYPISRRTRFSENLGRQQRTPGGRLIEAVVVSASAIVAEALEIAPGQQVHKLKTVGEADGRPVSVVERHFPADRFPDMADRYRETGSVTAALAAHGCTNYERRVSRVTARLPDAEDADLLGLSRRRPVLVVESVNADRDGLPVEHAVARFVGDRVQLVFEPGNDLG